MMFYIVLLYMLHEDKLCYHISTVCLHGKPRTTRLHRVVNMAALKLPVILQQLW